MIRTPEKKIKIPPKPATTQLGLSLQQRTPGTAIMSPTIVRMSEATEQPWPTLTYVLAKYALLVWPQVVEVVVVSARQMSHTPCSRYWVEGALARLLRVLQFGATVQVRSRIQPQGAKTIPKIRMPGVRNDTRTHSSDDRPGIVSAAVVVDSEVWPLAAELKWSYSDWRASVLTAGH